MITDYNIIGTILFSQSLFKIRQQLELMRKDRFEHLDRIVIKQDIPDDYPYIDSVGTKLIEIQKIVNRVDISNCFILLVTANKDISYEIDFVTQFYSTDTSPIEFLLVEGCYQKEIKKYNSTACQKLWNHFYVGTDSNVTPCCLADHRFPLGNINDLATINDNAEQIKSYMMQGYRTRACGVCYEKEDCNIQSARKVCDPASQTAHVTSIDVRLNNICNFKCRTCSEYFSSAIQQETIAMYDKEAVLGFEKIFLSKNSRPEKQHNMSNILSSLITTDLKSIYFAGGEPLIMPEHYQILDQLVATKNTDLSISYNTNLSTLVYKGSSVLDIWQQFSNVQVGASIDASGTTGEYMRHGTVWNSIVKNIHTIKQQVPHVKLQIASTVSCLTIENLINLQNTWINKQLFCVDDFRVNVLTSPTFLSPAMLPQHHKDRLSKIIQQHINNFAGTSLAKQWHNVLQWMNHNDYTFALNDFKHRTGVLDAYRNESFAAVFPEFQDLLVDRPTTISC